MKQKMVYVIGLDNVATNPDDISLRNQLFVAMTRARGWLTVSGTGDQNNSFYKEFRRVIDSGSSFEFINNPDETAKRDITELDFDITIDTEVVRPNLLIDISNKSNVSPELLKSIRNGNKAHHPYRDRLRDAAALGSWDQEAEDILYAIAVRGTNPNYTIKSHGNFLGSITK